MKIEPVSDPNLGLCYKITTKGNIILEGSPLQNDEKREYFIKAEKLHDAIDVSKVRNNCFVYAEVGPELKRMLSLLEKEKRNK